MALLLEGVALMLNLFNLKKKVLLAQAETNDNTYLL